MDLERYVLLVQVTAHVHITFVYYNILRVYVYICVYVYVCLSLHVGPAWYSLCLYEFMFMARHLGLVTACSSVV